MIERRLQVIQELREAYKDALSDLDELENKPDTKFWTLLSARMRVAIAYTAFQRAVEAYERARIS